MKVFPILSLLAVAISSATWADSIRDYVKQPDYEDFVMSPTGEYMAVIRKSEDVVEAQRDKSELQIIDVNKKEVIGLLRFRSNQTVRGMKKGDSVLAAQWGKDTRLIIRAGFKLGGLEQQLLDPDVVAVNIDGKKQETIFGPNAGRVDLNSNTGAKSNAGIGEWASMYVQDYLPDDAEEVIAVKYPRARGKEGGTQPTLFRLNLFNGKQTTLEKVAIDDSSLLLDQTGVIRFAERTTSDMKNELYYRAKADEPFALLASVDQTQGTWSPVAFAPDNKKVLVSSSIEASQEALYWWDPQQNTREEIYRHPNVDVGESNVLRSADGKRVIGFVTYDGKPQVHLLPGDEPEKNVYRLAMNAFKNKFVRVRSFSRDGSKAVVLVYSDIDAGAYFYIDAVNKKANKLAERMPWMKGQKLAEMKPIAIKTRDGGTMPGYLTTPSGKDAKNLPMVMVIHGGPYGPRDYWGYNPEVQLLASRGYAVLQVNFRGSGGYGKNYEYGAWGLWGTVMQDDLVDATQWAINEGIADRERICLYGHSYGGYASVWGITRDPDLYQCAIGSMGVYDLTIMDEEGDIAERKYGLNFVRRAIGNDDKELIARSPVYHVERIKAALLLSHGDEDRRAPIEHANRLREAMKKAHKPFDYMEFDKEGHGFANEDNREKFFTKVLGFLDQHIGH